MITATHDERETISCVSCPHPTPNTTNSQAQYNVHHVTDNGRKFLTGFQDWRLKDSPPKEHVYPEIPTKKERNVPPTPTELEISLELARYGISPLDFVGINVDKPQIQKFTLQMLRNGVSKEEALDIITQCREEPCEKGGVE